MISAKVKNLRMTLQLASAKGVVLNGGLIRMIQRQLADIHEQVLALEIAQMPDAQRLTPEHIASVKVTRIHREVPFE